MLGSMLLVLFFMLAGFVALREKQHEHAQEPHTIQVGRVGGVPFRPEALLRGDYVRWKHTVKRFLSGLATANTPLPHAAFLDTKRGRNSMFLFGDLIVPRSLAVSMKYSTEPRQEITAIG